MFMVMQALVLLGCSAPIVATDFARTTVYHSQQRPGYTCWVGAWVMPDGSMMISFTENTGRLEGRPRASATIRQKFYPHLENPARDATGLDKKVAFLASTDGGKTWHATGRIPFDGPLAYCAPGGQEAVLKDGSLIKGVFGYFQPDSPAVPQSAYLLRSCDRGNSWSRPQALGDPARETWRLTRLRRLADGRLIATGGRARVPSTSPAAEVWKRWEPLLIVSADEGRHWSAPIELLDRDQRRGWGSEEYDTAELPSGDLLCIFRRRHPTNPAVQVRWQGRLRKTGATWRLDALGPSTLPHSGHPELLVTREGPILHIATTGVDWTSDGQRWTPLLFADLEDGYRSRYYPKSFQTADGAIYVFGHLGSDNDYLARDQEIVMDRFRLRGSPRLERPAIQQATGGEVREAELPAPR